jgi:hypothetical protein
MKVMLYSESAPGDCSERTESWGACAHNRFGRGRGNGTATRSDTLCMDWMVG